MKRFIFSLLLLIYSLHHAYRLAGNILPTMPTMNKKKKLGKWLGASSRIQTRRERCLFDSFSHHVYEKRFIFSVFLIYSLHHAYRKAGNIFPTMNKKTKLRACRVLCGADVARGFPVNSITKLLTGACTVAQARTLLMVQAKRLKKIRSIKGNVTCFA